jgi:hypothetical protein
VYACFGGNDEGSSGLAGFQEHGGADEGDEAGGAGGGEGEFGRGGEVEFVGEGGGDVGQA